MSHTKYDIVGWPYGHAWQPSREFRFQVAQHRTPHLVATSLADMLEVAKLGTFRTYAAGSKV